MKAILNNFNIKTKIILFFALCLMLISNNLLAQPDDKYPSVIKYGGMNRDSSFIQTALFWYSQ
jgi:hypothetical protein